MRPIRIDFAPRSIKRAILLTPPVTRLLLLAAVMLWSRVAITALDLAHQNNDVEIALTQVLRQTRIESNEQAARKRVQSQFSISELQANAVNSTIAKLNLPWRELFDAIEAATPATIALLAVEPDAKKHVVKATAEAKTSTEMIAYVEQLKRQAFFRSVLLTKHEVNEQDPNKPLRFQAEAEWVEAMP